jgi:type II secretory pathway component GspD/PulD (secretin)
MDIPILGHLFKATRDRKEKRELMVLISPTVVGAGPAGLLEMTGEGDQDRRGGT